MDSDEASLLAELTTNLEYSFEKLMTMYWHQLYAFVLRRTANSQDAEDILSEAFVRSYIALKGYPIERLRVLKLRSWLYKITYHEYCRYIGRSASPLAPVAYLEEEVGFEKEDDENKQPEMLLQDAERRQELESLVAALPDRYREPVSLYYFEGFSYQEIADVLNQPIGTIKSSVHRGIRLLRKVVSTQSNEVY